MEEDMEHFRRFTMVGGNLKCKKHVVPHVFTCQPARLAKPLAPRLAVTKRNTARLVSDALASVAAATVINDTNVSHATEITSPVQHVSDEETPVQIQQLTMGFRDIGVQVRPAHRSKSSMCTPLTLGLLTSTQTSPIKETTSRTSSDPQHLKRKLPITLDLGLHGQSSFNEKIPRLTVDSVFTDSSSEDTECEVVNDSCSKWQGCKNVGTSEDEFPSTDESLAESSEDSFVVTMEEDNSRYASLKQTRFISKKHSMRYLGVPTDSLYIIDLLANKLGYRGIWLQREDVVLLVLRKIRLNESFGVIGDHFGISASYASRVFSKFTPIISSHLKKLIVWPKEESIRRLLPTSFQARYGCVQSIIDCFEIEIEKPNKAVHQALTWSDYKKCNTLKHLVSATPDGIINFVSKGYGGRVSDMILLVDCGYLDKLSEGMQVMADRGFKHVENAIKDKKCTLVRPPSVSSGVKLNAAECKQTKRIASLRIHIERVIRRIREFKLLLPHACVDIHMVDKIDKCVDIAAGLINLQGAIIK